jgi:glycosyltransferase involved in cell wall biosynthesis
MIMFEQGRVNHGDVILLNDIWFPGIEMLAYVRDALRLDFKIAGIAHAGTWDPMDFLSQMGMWRWGADLENSWFEIVDYILVNSHFHKDMLFRARKVDHNKMKVVGYPFKPAEFVIPYPKKENIVVFPHRLDPEKQPYVFDELAATLKQVHPNWEFIKTKDVWTDKIAYYNLLNRSKVAFSCALQETFGIAMVEAVMCGCIPVVPNRLSYSLMYDDMFKYRTTIDGVYFPSEFNHLAWAIEHADSKEVQHAVDEQRTYFMAQTNEFMGRVVNIVFDDPHDEWCNYRDWKQHREETADGRQIF